MHLEIDIKTYLKTAFNIGFVLVESKDMGMSEYCILEYPILKLEITHDRFDYFALIRYENEGFDLIHLANYINNNSNYEFFKFGFETREIDGKKYLQQIDTILKLEFDKILGFLFNMNASAKNNFFKYCEAENSKERDW